MERFWKIFWKVFGSAVLVMLIIGIVSGIIGHSFGLAYAVIQYTIAAALGICGVIGYVVVPIEMYFEDRNKRRTLS